jgi:hypothetical protein
VAIEAGDAVLESANAKIGADAAAVLPLRVTLSQDSGATADSYGSITARAAGAVNISASDDVTVGGIFSRRAITLASETGSILDAHPNTGLDILGGTVQLIAPLGSIGDIIADRPLSVGTNIGTPLTGLIEAQAGDSIYLNGPAGGPVGSNFTIGPVVAGHAALSAGNAIRISATDDALINGDVIAAGPVEFSIGKKLTLSAARDIEIADPAAPDTTITVSTPTAHVSATAAGVSISATEVLMEPGTTIALDTGSIAIATQGNATLAGIEIGAAPGNTVSMSSANGRMTIASLTGLGGGYTDNLDLTLSAPGGFTFDSLWTAHAAVRIPLGSLRINETRILDRATFTNPLTLVLVDQHDKSIQKADIQLYSGGDPFSMYLDANHLETNAFIIHRSPRHDVVTPDGVNESVDEQGSNVLATLNHSLPGGDNDEEEERSSGELISFTGVPVSLE